jgi:hypothetical protein
MVCEKPYVRGQVRDQILPLPCEYTVTQNHLMVFEMK